MVAGERAGEVDVATQNVYVGGPDQGAYSSGPELVAFAQALANGKLLTPAFAELALSGKYPVAQATGEPAAQSISIGYGVPRRRNARRLGSLNRFGPRVVSMDTGGSKIGIGTTAQVAQEAGITIDYNDPVEFNGQLLPSIHPDRISLGHAAGRHVPGVITRQQAGAGPNGLQFQTIGNFTHEFFKPFAVTLDFLGMSRYVTPAVPDSR